MSVMLHVIAAAKASLTKRERAPFYRALVGSVELVALDEARGIDPVFDEALAKADAALTEPASGGDTDAGSIPAT